MKFRHESDIENLIIFLQATHKITKRHDINAVGRSFYDPINIIYSVDMGSEGTKYIASGWTPSCEFNGAPDFNLKFRLGSLSDSEGSGLRTEGPGTRQFHLEYFGKIEIGGPEIVFRWYGTPQQTGLHDIEKLELSQSWTLL